MAKYPKTTGYWVYVHRTPDNMCYVGYSGCKYLCQRWNPKMYASHSLQPYIQKYGWDNIEHLVVVDNLTYEQALYWEDRLIKMYTEIGCCINQIGSGGWTLDKEKVKEHSRDYYYRPEVKEHRREYRQRPEVKEKYRDEAKKYYYENKEMCLEKKHRYYTENRDKILEKKLIYTQNHKLEKQEYDHKYDQRPERKLYIRVKSYNYCHPDRKLITPAEAKECMN